MRIPSSAARRWWPVLLAAAFGSTLGSPAASAAGRKKRDPTIAVRFHMQTNTADPTFGAKVMAGDPPREVLIEKIPSISERDIASFYPYKAADGSYSATFQLDPHGTATLEAISTQNRGMFIVAAVNGRPVTLLTVDKAITDGIIFIPSGLTEMDIRHLGESFDLTGRDYSAKKNKAPKPSAEDSGDGLPKPVL